MVSSLCCGSDLRARQLRALAFYGLRSSAGAGPNRLKRTLGWTRRKPRITQPCLSADTLRSATTRRRREPATAPRIIKDRGKSHTGPGR